jgi:hypothetical protein
MSEPARWLISGMELFVISLCERSANPLPYKTCKGSLHVKESF